MHGMVKIFQNLPETQNELLKVPGHSEVLHKDNFLTVFQWFPQFGMLSHLL